MTFRIAEIPLEMTLACWTSRFKRKEMRKNK